MRDETSPHETVENVIVYRRPKRQICREILASAVLMFLLSACGRNPQSIQDLVPPGGSGSRYPNLHPASEGSLLISWLEPTGEGSYSLRMSELKGEDWEPFRTVFSGDRFFVNWADFPSVFQITGDTLVAHWLYRQGGGTFEYDIMVSLSADRGRNWSVPISPHRDGVLAEHGFLSFFPMASGETGMVWLDGRNTKPASADGDHEMGNMSLYTTSLSSNGTLGMEILLDGRVCECCPTSAISLGNTTLIAYRDRSEEEVRDMHVVRYEQGHWGDPVVVHEDGWGIPGCPVNGPALAGEGSNLAVAWYTAPRGAAQVNVAFSSDGGRSFDSPIRVDNGTPLGRVDLEWLNGEAVVSWIELGADSGEVRIRKVSKDGSLGRALTAGVINTDRGSGFPRMIRTEDSILLAWTARNGSTDLVIRKIDYHSL